MLEVTEQRNEDKMSSQTQVRWGAVRERSAYLALGLNFVLFDMFSAEISLWRAVTKMQMSFSFFSEGRIKVVGGGSLQITDLVEEDAGVYTCVAENSNSTATSQAELTVQGTFTVSIPHRLLWSSTYNYSHSKTMLLWFWISQYAYNVVYCLEEIKKAEDSVGWMAAQIGN